MKIVDEEIFEDLHILVVDDNPANVQVLGNTLKRGGLNFEFALNGKSALGWMNKKQFHLILLDVMMPEMDGFQTLKAIRQNPDWEDVSIIFLTAKTDLGTLVRGFEEGIQDYLTKPFNPQELLSRVKAHLVRSAHQKLLRSFNQRLEELVQSRTQALQKSEQQLLETNDSLRNLIENIPSVVFKCYADNRFSMLFLSTQFQEMTGYDISKFLEDDGMTILDLIPESDQERFKKNISETRGSAFRVQTKMIIENGDMIWVLLQGNVRDSQGEEGKIIEGVMHDISQQVALSELLMTNSTQAADQERDLIARELHDGVQQYLASIALSLQGIPEDHISSESQTRFKESLARLGEATKEIRDISHRLAPKSVEDLGLLLSLRALVDRYKDLLDINVEENIGNTRFTSEIEINIYRIVQEAINNVTKYANASGICIQLFQREGLLTLMVEDDGKGFDQEDINYRKKGFGLLSMESRARSVGGFFEINSSEKNGTQIMVEIPI